MRKSDAFIVFLFNNRNTLRKWLSKKATLEPVSFFCRLSQRLALGQICAQSVYGRAKLDDDFIPKAHPPENGEAKFILSPKETVNF